MSDSAPNAPAQSTRSMALGDALASRGEKRSALITASVLFACAIVAGTFGLRQGPEIKPLVPIATSFWSIADILTAFLLFAQFYVNGRVSVAILATAYALSGFLTVTYVFAFPGLFLASSTLGQQQISIWCWVVWHCSFPILVAFATLNASGLRRIVSRERIHRTAMLISSASLLAAGAISMVAIACSDVLPRLIISGHFQPIYQHFICPLVIVLNLTVCAVLLSRRRRLTTLQLWLCLALFAACLDGGMNFSPTRYSYAWDVGKVITVFAASTVLIMILSEIVRLYGQLDLIARIDQLTRLPNRRAFDEHMQLVYHNAARLEGSMGLLVVDLDLFKLYNDSFGHAAGDDCLRIVSNAIATCATRPLDLVARYGGEEFVVVLPDTTARGVEVIGERIRKTVEALTLRHDSASPSVRVTVSIGAGYANNAARSSQSALFASADRALYQAKDRGRNRLVMGLAPTADVGPGLLLSA